MLYLRLDNPKIGLQKQTIYQINPLDKRDWMKQVLASYILKQCDSLIPSVRTKISLRRLQSTSNQTVKGRDPYDCLIKKVKSTSHHTHLNLTCFNMKNTHLSSWKRNMFMSRETIHKLKFVWSEAVFLAEKKDKIMIWPVYNVILKFFLQLLMDYVQFYKC